MKFLFRLSVFLLFLSIVFMVSNHQGLVQRALQFFFGLTVINMIVYFLDLRR